MSFFDTGDTAIYYEILGVGEPLVLLHGYALNGLIWEFQKPVLSENYRLIVVDLRGFGASSCGKNWSDTDMVEDVAALINHLGLKNCAVLGFSMSGPVAFRLTLELPNRVGKLVMVSSILPPVGRARKRTQAQAQTRELEILRLYGVEKWADMIGLRSGLLVDNMFRRNPDINKLWKRMIQRHNHEYLCCMLEARANNFVEENWRVKLKEVTQPTLLIAGEQDSSFLNSSKYLHRRIPNSKLEIISGAGHMVNLEAPEELNQALMGFLG